MEHNLENAMTKRNMSGVEEKIRLAVGSAAAASAIFAPLSNKWKGVLVAVAAETILTGIFGVSPLRHVFRG
jgi:hypothetical protein